MQTKEEIAARIKERKAEYRAEGRCFSCKNPAEPNYVYCKIHIERNKKRRDKKKILKQCSYCSQPSFGKKGRCLDCEKRIKERTQRYRDEGNCCICGKEPKPRSTRCIDCFTAGKNYKQKYRDSGRCRCNNETVNGKASCEKCLDRAKKRRKKNEENKLCRICSKPSIEHSHLCEDCYIKDKAKIHLKDRSKYIELKQKFNECKGICAYSGRKLVLGLNAEVDHIISHKNGGKDEIDNVQWIDKQMNRMKWQWTEEEFLEAVTAIYHHKIAPKCTSTN